MATRLLALLCLLPDGPAREYLSDITRVKYPETAVQALKTVNLIYEEHSRLKVLSPIRGYILTKDKHLPHPDDKTAVIKYYLELATKADCWPGEDERFIAVRHLLPPEHGNLHSVLSIAIVDGPPSPSLGYAIFLYTRFLSLTSPSIDLIKKLLDGDNWKEHLDPELAAKLMYFLGVAYTHVNQFKTSREQLESARQFALEKNVQLQAALSLESIGTTYRHQGRHTEALEALESALQELQGIASDTAKLHAARCQINICRVMVAMGSPGDTLERLLSALELFQTQYPNNRLEIASVLHSLGSCYTQLGNPDKAVATLEEAHAHMQNIGWAVGEAQTLYSLGWALFRKNEHDAAIHVLQMAAKMLKQLGDLLILAATNHALGYTFAKVHQLDAARDAFTEAGRIYEELGVPADKALTIHNMAIAFQQWDEIECIALYQEAREIYLGQNMPLPAAKCLKGQGVAKIKCGVAVPSEQVSLFTVAEAELREAGDISEAAWCLIFIGQYSATLRDFPRALDALERASNEFHKLGDTKFEDYARSEFSRIQKQQSYFASLQLAHIDEKQLQVQKEDP